MKIIRFLADDIVQYGILEDENIRILREDPYHQFELSDIRYRLKKVKLLSPCVPSKIVALGLNYHSHAEEVNLRLPEVPLIFIKPASAAIGPEDSIVYPPSTNQVDYEGELAVVIKKHAWKVPVENVEEYVLGYTCLNDVTARDLQSKDRQWTRSKGFDTFAPFGPCIDTEIDAGHATLETRVNGELKQFTNTKELIFSVPEVVSFISHVMTLLPGDVIATGTPEGIGPLFPGDMVEVEIQGIGILKNYVVNDSTGDLR